MKLCKFQMLINQIIVEQKICCSVIIVLYAFERNKYTHTYVLRKRDLVIIYIYAWKLFFLFFFFGLFFTLEVWLVLHEIMHLYVVRGQTQQPWLIEVAIRMLGFLVDY